MTLSDDLRAAKGLIDWLDSRGHPDSGIVWEGHGYDFESGRLRHSRVELRGSDADFIAKHFHGQGARDLADALRRAISTSEAQE